MEKLILTLAPTGNVPTRKLTPHVPLTATEIAEDIAACREKGAVVAHLHARDEQGQPTCEKEYFAQIIKELDDRQCPVLRQISTGARGGRSGEARAQALEVPAHSASLATGSSNFSASVNANSPELIEYMAKIMLERQIKPEIEVFDTAMIETAVQLQKRGILKPPLLFNLVMGVKGSQPATARQLLFLIENLPADAVWGVSVVGPQHVPLSMMAMALGGHVRVGIEDNIYYTKGVLATNLALVERMAGIAAAMGRELATPADVRRIWQVKE